MASQTPTHLSARNPLTHARHRKEVFWQIILPFILFFLLIVILTGGVIWAGFSASEKVSRWADISLIWLLILPIGFSLLVLGLTLVSVIGVARVLKALPGAMNVVQVFFTRIDTKVETFSDQLVEPIMKLQSLRAGTVALKKFISARTNGK